MPEPQCAAFYGRIYGLGKPPVQILRSRRQLSLIEQVFAAVVDELMPHNDFGSALSATLGLAEEV